MIICNLIIISYEKGTMDVIFKIKGEYLIS